MLTDALFHSLPCRQRRVFYLDRLDRHLHPRVIGERQHPLQLQRPLLHRCHHFCNHDSLSLSRFRNQIPCSSWVFAYVAFAITSNCTKLRFCSFSRYSRPFLTLTWSH